MTDPRYLTPSIGAIAVMVDSTRELRISSLDGGHAIGIMVAENYRPTLNVQDVKSGGGPPGKSTWLQIRKPYTLDNLILALERARDQAQEAI